MPVVLPISAFSDNYIWLVLQHQQAIIVDPGEAAPVLAALTERQAELTAILVTHWHADHTGGIKELLQHYPKAQVIGPKHDKIPSSQIVQDKDSFTVAGLHFTAMHVPGHTLEHTVYYQAGHGWLFSGDTLFAAGCGRVFEGSNQQMLSSLQRLAQLPNDTQVFCAHEYTLSNLAFAQAVEPTNSAITERIQHCKQLRQQGQPTVPSTIAEERQSNPFLRLDAKELIQTAQQQGANSSDALSVFTCLREWKNNF